MKAAEKLELVRRIAERLGRESWDEIDFVLSHMDFPTFGLWEGDEVSYVRYSLRDAKDANLYALQEYLFSDAPDTGRDEDQLPWEDKFFRVVPDSRFGPEGRGW